MPSARGRPGHFPTRVQVISVASPLLQDRDWSVTRWTLDEIASTLPATSNLTYKEFTKYSTRLRLIGPVPGAKEASLIQIIRLFNGINFFQVR
jgi:hypothetical protein